MATRTRPALGVELAAFALLSGLLSSITIAQTNGAPDLGTLEQQLKQQRANPSASASASASAAAAAAADREVRARLALQQSEIKAAADAGDATRALSVISAWHHSLPKGMTPDPGILLIEAKMSAKTQDYPRAVQAVERLVATAKEGSPPYTEALALYPQLKAQMEKQQAAAALRAKENAEAQRRAAAAQAEKAARQAEETAAAQRRAAEEAAAEKVRAEQIAQQQAAAAEQAKHVAAEQAHASAIVNIPTLVATIEQTMQRIKAGSVAAFSHRGSNLKRFQVAAFRLSAYPVTFEQFDQYAAATGRPLPDDAGWGRDKRPVINVSKLDAEAFIYWLNQHSKKPFRLPTQIEWDYAASAGATTKYPWGPAFSPGFANCKGLAGADTYEHTSPVGSFPANTWDLYDMIGNVYQWTSDNWEFANHYNLAVDLGTLLWAPIGGHDTTLVSWGRNTTPAAVGGSWDTDCDRAMLWSENPRLNTVGFRLAQSP